MLSACVGRDSSESPGSSRQGITGKEPTNYYNKLNPITDFPIPVDPEHKATVLRPLSVAQPHMRAFHLSWISFFTCFFSTFAAAPLLPVIRNNLDLTAIDIANAGIASVAGSVFSRLCAGPLCDLAGPRYTCASLLLLTAPAVFMMATVSSATGFVLARFFIGFSLATLVSSQFWMGSMFSSNILALANGATTGLGNVGAGATQLLMPLLYLLIHSSFHSTAFTAWRIAFFVPGLMQVTMGLLVLCLGQDLPDGNYARDRSSDKLPTVAWYAVTNYRSWVLAITYGYCFGVELTVNNIIASYFYDRFDLDVEIPSGRHCFQLWACEFFDVSVRRDFVRRDGASVGHAGKAVDPMGASDNRRSFLHFAGQSRWVFASLRAISASLFRIRSSILWCHLRYYTLHLS